MSQQLICEIGGVDHGPGGTDLLLPGWRVTDGGPGRIGDGQLSLRGAPGVDALIVNQMYVRLYLLDTSTNRVTARYFCGHVSAVESGQIPGTPEKTWIVTLQDVNVQLQALVAPVAWAQAYHIAAGTFAAQVENLVQAYTLGADEGIDATTRVLNLTGSAILPAFDAGGITLQDALGQIFTRARQINPRLRPVCTLIPDPAVPGGVGAGFGPPILDCWDAAAPPSPVVLYSTTPDSTHHPILPATPFGRRRESPRYTNWQQMVDKNGQLYTSTPIPGGTTTYRNRFAPDGTWRAAAIHNTQDVGVGAHATGTATVSGGAVTGVTVALEGTGYPAAPALVFSGGGGTGAEAQAVMYGYLLTLTITAPGTGYLTAPTVAFSGGGGTGAAATAQVDGAGVLTALTITAPGTGYTSAPTVSFSGGGGTGAAATASIGGHVHHVVILAGGSGYTSAPTVLFTDAVQQALDAQVAPLAAPRELIQPLLVDVPAPVGSYVGVTLDLEVGIVESVYLVQAMTPDYATQGPDHPIYTLELGARRLRLGETDATDVYAPPVEGVRLSPPGNFVAETVYSWALSGTILTITWTPPVPPPALVLDHYDWHLTVDGVPEVLTIPGTSPGARSTPVAPGAALSMFLVAVDQTGRGSLPSAVLTLTAAARPDPPTAPTGLAFPGNGFNPGTGQTDLTLTWAASTPGTGCTIAVYEIDVTLPDGNIYVYTTPALLLSFSLPPNLVISATVTAVDNHGQRSAPSTPATLTTSPHPAPPTAPAWVGQTNAFNPATGLDTVTYTWIVSTPGAGRTIDHYELWIFYGPDVRVLAVGTGTTYTDSAQPPGGSVQALIYAVDDLGQGSPTGATLGPFAVADTYAPDPPTDLHVTYTGYTLSGTGWALIGFTPPGTTHGPHDTYEVRVHLGPKPLPTYRVPGDATALPVTDLDFGLIYTVDARSWADSGWPGPWSDPVSVVVDPPNMLPVGTGYSSPDQPFAGYTASDDTQIVPVSLSYRSGTSWAFTPPTGESATLTAAGPLGVTPGTWLSYGVAWLGIDGDADLAGQLSLTGDTGDPTILDLTPMPRAATLTDDSGTPLTDDSGTPLITDVPWAYKEDQMQVPTGVKTLLTAILITVGATAGTVLVDLYHPPQPTKGAPQLTPGAVGDLQVGVLTDPSKLALKTGTAGGYDYYDLLGVLRGRDFYDTAGVIHRLGFGTTGQELQSGVGDTLFVGDPAGPGGIGLSSASGFPVTINGATVDNAGVLRTGGYQSSDGTAGMTADITLGSVVLHVKDGLIVGHTP